MSFFFRLLFRWAHLNVPFPATVCSVERRGALQELGDVRFECLNLNSLDSEPSNPVREVLSFEYSDGYVLICTAVR